MKNACRCKGQDSRDRFTVPMCTNTPGTLKCILLITGKCAKPRALNGMKTMPVIYKAKKRAWAI